MPLALIVVCWLAAQGPASAATTAKPDPDQFPMALHRSMEIDDLDREIQQRHDAVLMKRAELATTGRLVQRGVASRSDLERETVSVQYEEAREAETRAYRAIKVYERDVNGQVMAADEQKAYGLILDWIKAREAIGQVDVRHHEFVLRQTQALYQRKAVTRQELEDAELSHDMAVAGLALSQSRKAQVVMELAARKGESKYDPATYDRLHAACIEARVHYYELTAQNADRRLAIAQERARRGLLSSCELPPLQQSADDARATLAGERRKLEKPDLAANQDHSR